MLTICIDFDGVIHSYKSGWQGVNIISDPPVESPSGFGALKWLKELVLSKEFIPMIYSSRSQDESGIQAMKNWFEDYGFKYTSKLEFPTQKPAAFLTIDDRAICFNGTFPTFDEMKNFKPWNKK